MARNASLMGTTCEKNAAGEEPCEVSGLSGGVAAADAGAVSRAHRNSQCPGHAMTLPSCAFSICTSLEIVCHSHCCEGQSSQVTDAKQAIVTGRVEF